MLSLIFFCFVLNTALMTLGPCDSHPISTFWADLDNIRATPSVWGASSSSWPENRIICPLISLFWPDSVNPSRFADSEQSYVVPLHLCCYLCGFPPLEHSPYIPRSYSGVSEKRKAIPSCGFQIPQAFTTIYLDFILLLAEDPSSLREGISRSSLVGVSVAKLVFWGKKAGLTLNPQPGGPECFFVWPLSRRPIRHGWTCQEHKAPAGTALEVPGARKLPRHNKAKHQGKRVCRCQ